MKTAQEKAGEMMLIPMNQLPELALEFLRWVSSKIGFCSEVCHFSYSIYCHAVEGLPTEEELPDEYLEFFRNK